MVTMVILVTLITLVTLETLKTASLRVKMICSVFFGEFQFVIVIF